MKIINYEWRQVRNKIEIKIDEGRVREMGVNQLELLH